MKSFLTPSEILAANTIPKLQLSLLALCKNTTCMQKPLIRCFCKTRGQLVYLQSAIRERQKWDKVLLAT